MLCLVIEGRNLRGSIPLFNSSLSEIENNVTFKIAAAKRLTFPLSIISPEVLESTIRQYGAQGKLGSGVGSNRIASLALIELASTNNLTVNAEEAIVLISPFSGMFTQDHVPGPSIQKLLIVEHG